MIQLADAYPKLPTVWLINIPSQNIDALVSAYGQNKTYIQTKLVWTRVFLRLVLKWTYNTSGFVW